MSQNINKNYKPPYHISGGDFDLGLTLLKNQLEKNQEIKEAEVREKFTGSTNTNFSRFAKCLKEYDLAEFKRGGKIKLTEQGKRVVRENGYESLSDVLKKYEPYKEFLSEKSTVVKDEVANTFSEKYGMSSSTASSAGTTMMKLADKAGIGNYKRGSSTTKTRLLITKKVDSHNQEEPTSSDGTPVTIGSWSTTIEKDEDWEDLLNRISFLREVNN